MRTAILVFGLACGCSLLGSCANPFGASASADLAIENADDAECRAKGEPGTTAYNRCRATKTAFRDRMAPSPGAGQ
jgi:hypothetical protein